MSKSKPKACRSLSPAPRSLPQIKNNLPLSLAPHRPPQMKNNTAAIRMSAIMDVKSFNITVNSQKQY